jgi:hypothetical protein
MKLSWVKQKGKGRTYQSNPEENIKIVVKELSWSYSVWYIYKNDAVIERGQSSHLEWAIEEAETAYNKKGENV